MADKLRDTEDQLLEAMFSSETIADGGFSNRIVARIRRGIWIRRLSLPIAMLVGGSIAVKPVSQLITAGTQLMMAVPQDVLNVPESWIPQAQMLILGAILFAVGMVGMRMIED
ncbi:MAG: hypothetical protein GWN47_03920 [Woeseiaceae bacterium]|nr:hypothetical protein [Woeseiaceae bacterium]